ncbi:hypothetical protein HDU87_008454 [Geranomyces variabilis]|uniref:Uncharacterized protein n=1 Tax=Geranomyces variabilis TaxID=109894 RepID=A0AAD5TCW7_9FUNG|nr:hypothetical protein HDU87_008454 [Geranomyces variabilis]
MAVPVPSGKAPTRRVSAKKHQHKATAVNDCPPPIAPSPKTVVAVGTAADLDFEASDLGVLAKLHRSWDLIESGAASQHHQVSAAEPSASPRTKAFVEITFNAGSFAVPATEPLTLKALGLDSNNFVYVDGAFVKTSRHGETRIAPAPGMRVEVQPYPALQPLNVFYWLWGNFVPDRKQIAKALQSPWGRTLINAFNSLILSLLARPGIAFSSTTSPAQLILTVISSGKMLDLMLKDTLLRLLTDASLTTTHVLFSLAVCELCVIVAASIDFLACAKLFEFHALPALLFCWVFLRPAIHRAWVKTSSSAFGCIIVFILIFGVVTDLSWRSSFRIESFRTCQIASRPVPTGAKERAML